MMSFHDPYQHPAASSSAAAWRAFPGDPFDDHHPSLDHHHHPLDHRPLVLPQVPHIPRQPAGFADDHHSQHDHNPQLRGDFYYDGEYAYQPQQRHTQHSLFAAPAHFDALHMGHAQPQGWAPGPEQSFRVSEQGLRASDLRASDLRASEHYRASEQFTRPSEQTFRSEQSFRPSEHPFPSAFAPFDGFPAGSSHPPPRLEPPSLHPTSRTLGGPLDGPGGGIFYRSPEHPRLRTAQACEKCRVRKAKCSGDHPSCKRCQARGLACEYAKEGRTRGPNKTKKQQAAEAAAGRDGQARDAPNGQAMDASNGQARAASNGQGRDASSSSSAGEDIKNGSDASLGKSSTAPKLESHADMSRAPLASRPASSLSKPTSSLSKPASFLSKPPTPPDMVSHLQKEVNKRMSLPTLSRPHRLSTGMNEHRMSLSMGEHRGGSRPRPPDLRLETQSLLYRLESDGHHSAVDSHHSAVDSHQHDHHLNGLQRHDRQHLEGNGRYHDDHTNGRYHEDHTPRRHGHSLSADAVSPGLTPRYPSLGQGGVSAQMGSSASLTQMGSSANNMAQTTMSARQSREGSYDGSFDSESRGCSFDGESRGSFDGAYNDGRASFDDGSSCSSEGMMYASAPEAFSQEGSATYSHEGSATFSHEGSATYSHEGSATYSRGGSGTSSYSSSLRSPIDSPGGLGHPALASGMVSPAGLSVGGHGMLSPGGNHAMLSPGGHSLLSPGGHPMISPGDHPLLSPGGHSLLSPGGHQMLGHPDDGGAYTDPMAYAGGQLPWTHLPSQQECTTLNAPQPHTAETFAFAGKGGEYIRQGDGYMRDHSMQQDGLQHDASDLQRDANGLQHDANGLQRDANDLQRDTQGDEYMRGAEDMQHDAHDTNAMPGVPGDAQYAFGRGSDGGSSL
ncbi:hypothetical protein EV714DRAFT_237332 [Schizophyllum commune]